MLNSNYELVCRCSSAHESKIYEWGKMNKIQNSELELSEIHIVNIGSDNLLFNINNLLVIKTDKIGNSVVDYLSKNKKARKDIIIDELSKEFAADEIEETISELITSGFIIQAGDKPKDRSPDAPSTLSPFNICLNITHKCNLRCVYCYGDGGSFGSRDADMDYSVAVKSIDWAVANAKRTGTKRIGVTFFGGEPLCNFKLIEPVANYAKKTSKDNGLDVFLNMTTNGALMTTEIAEKLKELDISVLFSIDGPPEIQNSQRPMAGGGPSFEACVQGARLYRSIAKKRISARATLTNYDLVEIESGLKKAGFDNVYASISCSKYGAHYVTEEGVDKLIKAFEDLFAKYLNNASEDQILGLPRSNIFVKVLTTIASRKRTFWPCGAGRSYVAIAPDGKIYVCHRFVGDDRFCIGDVITDEIDDSFYTNHIKNQTERQPECRNCWVRSDCAGGCMHHNLVFGGGLYQHNEHLCEFTKKSYELAIKCYYQIFNKYPELLNKLFQANNPIEYEIESINNPKLN
jgi:uncharacterized protein